MPVKKEELRLLIGPGISEDLWSWLELNNLQIVKKIKEEEKHDFSNYEPAF